MAIQILNTQITLDLYDDKNQAKIKTIQLDSKTRYVDAIIQYRGATYDIGQDTEVVLTVIRPDGTGVQITGEPIAHTESSPEGGAVTTYGAYAEFTPAALAKKGVLKAQFMLISGDQVMRTEIFTIANEVALDESTDTWAKQIPTLQGSAELPQRTALTFTLSTLRIVWSRLPKSGQTSMT